MDEMAWDRCDECGFDGERWTDEGAVDAIGRLPARWEAAVAGLDDAGVLRRPIPGMWSIGEYVDHVREVLFAMRFVLDSAVAEPGVDLGEAPEPEFAPAPRAIDVRRALAGIDREATELSRRFEELPVTSWTATATIGGDAVDARWICRHAVHDATHHLQDVERLRRALDTGEHASSRVRK
jgi:DinB superfamily